MADQRTSLRNAQHGPKVVAQDIHEESEKQKHRLGERLVLGDRIFRYVKNGSTALVAGKCVQANNAFVSGTIQASAGVEQDYIRVTTTGISSADYDEGYVVLYQGTGSGRVYKIKTTNASVGSYTQLYLYDPLCEQVTTTTQIQMLASRYNAVVIANTATSSSGTDIVGVPLVAITASYYGWVQTKGPCACHVTTAVGGNPFDRLLALSTSSFGSLDTTTTAYVASTATGAVTIYDFADVPVARVMTKDEALTALKFQLVDLILE